MSFKSPGKYLKNKTTRKLALIYGVVMVNIGALMLYNKFSAGELIYDQQFNIGAGCLGIGLVVLFFVYQHKDET